MKLLRVLLGWHKGYGAVSRFVLLFIALSLCSCGVHVYHHHAGHLSPVFGPDREYWAVKDDHLTCVCMPEWTACGKKVAYEMLRQIKAGQVDYKNMSQDQCTRMEYEISKQVCK